MGQNILLGIDKILASNKDIIIIGINNGHEFDQLLTQSKYSQILKLISATNLRDVLFILKKSNLHLIEHKDLKEDEISKYNLERITKELNLYVSVIDLNQPENAALKAAWELEDNLDDSKV